MEAVECGLAGDEASTRDRAPLEIVPTCESAWIARAILVFVAIGVLLRVVRYLAKSPLWCDESMLAANLLDRGYLELLRPLDFRQVCPVLFLFVELTAVKWLGFSELSLRLFPLGCGVASLFLFQHVAGRLLRGEALLFAVAVFAVSSWPLRYAGEVKPYASDLFMALAVLALAVEWWRRPDKTAWLWGLVILAPIALGLSFPMVLVTGGVSVGLSGMVWRSGRRDVLLAFFAYNLVIAVTFLSLLRFYQTAPQDHAYFHHDWAPAFPPLGSPWRLIGWFLETNTGYMFAYPEGGERGASAGTFACFLVAAVVLWRRRRRTVLALCLAPFGLALVAAALHRYPYGMSARTMQYVAPTICLLAGLGAARILGLIPSRTVRRRAVYASVATLAALGAGRMSFELLHPYRSASDELHRGLARWFWTEKSRDAELVCPKVDFALEFSPEHWSKDGTEMYLCYQRIYSPRHHRLAAPRLDAVSATHPLRFVFFNEFPDRHPAFSPWLAEMSRTFALRSIELYPISAPPNTSQKEWGCSYLVYEFTPRPGLSPGPLAGFTSTGPIRR